jgi:hypothetical protein
MKRRMARFLAAAMAAIVLGATMVGATLAKSDVQAAKAATAQFHDLSVAGGAGFGPFAAPAPLHFCIASLDNTGAMGFHWLNGANINNVTDPTRPAVLVYAPDKHGRLHLAALEFVIFQDAWFADHAAGTMPEMFGQMMMANDGVRFELPPFFALHVWLFQDNPSGMFAPFNPNVSCDGASASATTAAGSVRLAAVTAADTARFVCRTRAATA